MKQLKDCSDARSRVSCTHCQVGLDPSNANKDHVPSKCLLARPLPPNLPTVMVCRSCNESFSKDEEYLCVFLAAVISGDVDPDPSLFPSAAASVEHNPGLRERITRAQRHQSTLWGEPENLWIPEFDRVNNVIVKNARGHVLHELGEPVSDAPSGVGCWPMVRLTADQRDTFECVSLGAGWPEVGSRMMQRLAGVDPLVDGWVEVQEGVYRYAVVQGPDGLLVRTVIREYLATEVHWSPDQAL